MANGQTAVKVRPLRQIGQSDLQALLEAKAQIEAVEHKLKELKSSIEPLEEALKVKLEAGWSQEQGKLVGSINVTERRNVQWKAVVFRRCGAQVQEEEQAACEPTVYKKVVVLPRVE